jgi:hypothetical protein
MTNYVEYDRVGLPPRPDGDLGWTEPESAASSDYPPKYPFNNITQTESGHMFEMDDTPGGERVRIHHRSGTFIEMHPNGDEVHKIYGDGYEIVTKNKNVLIKGVCNITIQGDSIVHVLGDKKELVEGNYSLVVKGDYDLAVKGVASLMSNDDMTIGCGEIAAGSLNIMTGSHLQLSGDLSIDGELTALNIISKGRVDAATGVSAGFLGFVSVEGGLSIGIPAAIPGTINCIGLIDALGPITSLISMEAPLGTFGTMEAILMTDVVNSSIYDYHFHFGFAGPTSPPVPPFIGL